MELVIVGTALGLSVVSLWVAQRASQRSSALLFCQQRNDFLLTLREVREQLVSQASLLTDLQDRPLAALDSAHVTSLWDTVNTTVADLDDLRAVADGWAHHRPSHEFVGDAFDRLQALSMQLDRVRTDVCAIDERSPAPAVEEEEELVPAS